MPKFGKMRHWKFVVMHGTHRVFISRCLVLLGLLASGTTGKPKGVAISHSALFVQSMAKIAICGYSENDVCPFQVSSLLLSSCLVGNWKFHNHCQNKSK